MYEKIKALFDETIVEIRTQNRILRDEISEMRDEISELRNSVERMRPTCNAGAKPFGGDAASAPKRGWIRAETIHGNKILIPLGIIRAIEKRDDETFVIIEIGGRWWDCNWFIEEFAPVSHATLNKYATEGENHE